MRIWWLSYGIAKKCDNLNDLDVDYVRHKLLDKKNLELDFALLIPTVVDMWRVTCDIYSVMGGGGGGWVWRVERGERNKSTESFPTSSEVVECKMMRLIIFFQYKPPSFTCIRWRLLFIWSKAGRSLRWVGPAGTQPSIWSFWWITSSFERGGGCSYFWELLLWPHFFTRSSHHLLPTTNHWYHWEQLSHHYTR